MKKRTDGRYCVTAVIGGKKKFFYGDTRAEATEKRDKYIAKEKAPKKFREIAEAWYNEKWYSFAYGTQNCYRSAYNKAIEAIGSTVADDVEPITIQLMLEDMKKQDYSQKSVKTQKTVISTIYRYGILHGMCKTNPATYTEIPKNLSKEKREPPSDEAIEKIKADTEGWIYPKILLYTGCRRGEALALTYEDFDFVKNEINIDKEIVYKSNTPYLVYRTKTHAGKRKVPFIDALKPFIDKNKKGALFTNTLRTFKTEWKHYCDRLEITVTPHQLRHAYATMLFDAGIEPKIAQKLLGHSSLKMTMDIYTHIRESRLGDVTDKLNFFTKL